MEKPWKSDILVHHFKDSQYHLLQPLLRWPSLPLYFADVAWQSLISGGTTGHLVSCSSFLWPLLEPTHREGNGTPLQYSCLENPMEGGAWWAAVHGVTKSQTRLSDFTFTFHFHALEKKMATHSSVLAWRIPGMGEPGGLLSMGSHRVRHDWSDLAAEPTQNLSTHNLNVVIVNTCTALEWLWTRANE